MSNVRVLDVETTIRTSFKRKANAFDPNNWVVYVGTKDKDSESTVRRFHSKEESKGWLADVVSARGPELPPKIIVTFNGKFDILHGIANDPKGLDAWMVWVVGGGILWDCQIAEYLLRGKSQDAHMLSLDEVAPVYGGVVKNSEVKDLWNAGIDTPDISEDLIVPYLHGDCTNTEKVFEGQLARARSTGQLRSLLLNFGSLLYTIEAERNGMFTDKQLGLELAAKLEARKAELDTKLNEALPSDLPFEFNWGSRHQLSALVFGGEVKYKVRDFILNEAGELTYTQKEELHYLLENGTTMGIDWWEHCNNTEWALTGPPEALSRQEYKSGKNAGLYKTKKVKVNDLDNPKTKIFERLYTFKGYTEPSSAWETSTPGVYQINSDVIEALGNRGIPFLSDLSERAKVVKDLGTYFITTDPKTGEQKGMLTLVQPDGIIHHMLNHTSTVTGRFSSSNPNMQNIPKGNKSEVKRIFISRFPDGKIIQSDFTALEIYIQAILTGDKQLIEDLKAGLDMHCQRVATKFNIPYEEAVRLCKVEKVEEWVYHRTGAKEFSFQRAYGAGAQAISDATGLPVEDVLELIRVEEERYSGINPYFDNLAKLIEQSKVHSGRYVSHPDFPTKSVELCRGYARTPDNNLYSYSEHPAPKYVVQREGKFASFSPPEIKNYFVQGEGAEWAKAAMWLAVRAFYERKNFDGLAVLINQVHDACYADSHPSVLLDAAALLHACMEAASEFMSVYFNWTIPVHVPSETTCGNSMMDEEEIPNLREHAEKYRIALRNTYIKP